MRTAWPQKYKKNYGNVIVDENNQMATSCNFIMSKNSAYKRDLSTRDRGETDRAY